MRSIDGRLAEGHLRRLVRRILTRWPKTRILFRGDGHYARPEAMAWCEDNGLQYVFGLSGSTPLSRKVEGTADAVRTERAIDDKEVVRRYAETRHRAGSWNREQRALARIEATRLLDDGARAQNQASLKKTQTAGRDEYDGSAWLP